MQNVCSWSSWSKTIECEWVDYHCIKGYKRTCLCNNILSEGSACSQNGNKLENYIQTKPYVSNFDAIKGMCFKDHCPQYKNWCPWETWSYWFRLTNKTCERQRVRKCCETQPASGYTRSSANNYGCFVSKSQQNSSDYDRESKEMQCSPFTQRFSIYIYISIGICCLVIVWVICRFTRSSNNNIKPIIFQKEISFEETISPNVPTAPIDQPSFVQPIINDVIREPFISNPGLPNTPPSYDETIGINNFSEPVKYTSVPIQETVNEDDSKTNSQKSSTDEMANRGNTENIPPPSYALYLRNPSLFNRNN